MSTLKTINLQHPTAATANITLSNTGGIALNGSVSGGGMDLITPTSVVGGTYVGGAISFSASSSVSVNGAFTSTYSNYQIFITGVGSTDGTGTASVKFKYRTSGIDTSANYYTLGIYGTNAAGPSRFWDNNTGDSSVGWLFNYYGQIIIDVAGPQLNLTKSHTSRSFGTGTAASLGGSTYCLNTNTTQFDGYTISAGVGTITGTMRIYGLRNS